MKKIYKLCLVLIILSLGLYSCFPLNPYGYGNQGYPRYGSRNYAYRGQGYRDYAYRGQVYRNYGYRDHSYRDQGDRHNRNRDGNRDRGDRNYNSSHE